MNSLLITLIDILDSIINHKETDALNIDYKLKNLAIAIRDVYISDGEILSSSNLIQYTKINDITFPITNTTYTTDDVIKKILELTSRSDDESYKLINIIAIIINILAVENDNGGSKFEMNRTSFFYEPVLDVDIQILNALKRVFKFNGVIVTNTPSAPQTFTAYIPGGLTADFAGIGTRGFSGDGGLGGLANIFDNERLYFDRTSNSILISDSGNHRIRSVDITTGVITTIAGSGGNILSTQGSRTGDGGLATVATLIRPKNVTSDNNGNIYFAQSFSVNRVDPTVIMKIDVNTGIITRIAGADIGYWGDGGPVLNTGFKAISGLACDSSGNLYVADKASSVVRKLDFVTDTASTVIGNGIGGDSGDGGLATVAMLSLPRDIAIDSNDNLYVTSFHRVRKVTISTGIISAFAGSQVAGFSGDGGLATVATLNTPNTLMFDGLDNLFISDSNYNIVRRVDTISGIITSVVGNSVLAAPIIGVLPLASSFLTINGLAFDYSGNMYVSDTNSYKVIKIPSV